jgi:hypothetical protein
LELRRDTDKLLQLTSELKQYVDKTNQNILSLEVIRKAVGEDEIEISRSTRSENRDHRVPE